MKFSGEQCLSGLVDRAAFWDVALLYDCWTEFVWIPRKKGDKNSDLCCF